MTHIELRGDTATGWTTANPVLYWHELGVEDDTGLSKLGDGETHWVDLPYTTAIVVVTKEDLGLEHVDNTSDLDKPISSETQEALDAKASNTNMNLRAPKDSPTFTGNPAAPTPDANDNDTSIATTAFVKAQGYATLSNPEFTGNPKAPTPGTADSDTSIATTAFVHAVADAVAALLPKRSEFIGEMTNGSGDLTFPHGLGVKPRYAHVSAYNTNSYWTVQSVDATNIIARYWTAAGVARPSTVAYGAWIAVP